MPFMQSSQVETMLCCELLDDENQNGIRILQKDIRVLACLKYLTKTMLFFFFNSFLQI